MCLRACEQQADPVKQEDVLIVVWKYFMYIKLFICETVFSYFEMSIAPKVLSLLSFTWYVR